MSPASLLVIAAVNGASPDIWRSLTAGALLVAALIFALPTGVRHGRTRRALALASGIAGLALLWWTIPRMGSLAVEADFWVLALMTLVAAAAAISSRSPVYCAIWFAVSLLGSGGLLLLQGAHFLGVATVAVYAGAIVVTFLFVLMLAQPGGHTYYDRVSWGRRARWTAVVTATVLALMLVAAVTRPDAQVLSDRQAVLEQLRSAWAEELPAAEPRAIRYENSGDGPIARLAVSLPAEVRDEFETRADVLRQRSLQIVQAQHPSWQITGLRFDLQDVWSTSHTASLGSQLFSRHLITVQAAGALLLAALVGALAIVGRRPATDGDFGGMP